jgi:mitochondrial distribution and morphology protein 12
MSVDVNWKTLTEGPDGRALAESIRSFIHDKFQEVTLPRFIRAINVHAFDLGQVGPDIEIKDICDPLPDFYEDEDTSSSNGATDECESPGVAPTRANKPVRVEQDRRYLHSPQMDSSSDTGIQARQHVKLTLDQMLNPLLPRAPTPGIPGGTSNLNYFHLPLSAGLSGTATPLAAVVGGQFHSSRSDLRSPLNGTPPWDAASYHHSTGVSSVPSIGDPNSRPSSQHQSNIRSSRHESNTKDDDSYRFQRTPSTSPPRHLQDADPMDVQVIAHVKYSGDLTMTLTAEIHMDYPMDNFVGIPLRLNVTGISFDGVAIIAHIKRRAHFCFLSPEDAEAVLNAEDNIPLELGLRANSDSTEGHTAGGLLQHIKVESEIGQQENGKQVLKNVGKVEKFILEQVRRIFEEELVYPSFWTFLV